MATHPFETDPCDAIHPEFPGTRCIEDADDLHPDHRGRLHPDGDDDAEVLWPNEDVREVLAVLDLLMLSDGPDSISVTVRRAKRRDSDALISIFNAALDPTELDSATVTRDHEVVRMVVEGMFGRGDLWIAELGDMPVAFLGLTKESLSSWADDSDPALYVFELVAKEPGYGIVELLDFALDEAADARCDRLRAESDDEELSSFYESLGFERRGTASGPDGTIDRLELIADSSRIEAAMMKAEYIRTFQSDQ